MGPLPVSFILEQAGLVRPPWWARPEMRDVWRDRRRTLHAFCDRVDQGSLDWSTVPPELVPYVRAYSRFVERAGSTLLAGRTYLEDRTRRWCGSLDRRFSWPGCPRALVDIKTDTPAVTVAIKTAGYQLCLDEHHERFTLLLFDTGRFKLRPCDGAADFDIFQAAVTVVEAQIALGVIRAPREAA